MKNKQPEEYRYVCTECDYDFLSALKPVMGMPVECPECGEISAYPIFSDHESDVSDSFEEYEEIEESGDYFEDDYPGSDTNGTDYGKDKHDEFDGDEQ